MKKFMLSVIILLCYMQNVSFAQSALLDISPREYERDDYCAEVCIQEALMYYGMNLSQDDINKAGGKDNSSGLENREQITQALNNLGANFETWYFTQGQDMNYSEYLDFLKSKLSQGFPVLAGVKINPTKHPEWINDHYILLAGFTDDSFIYNSPSERETMTFADFENSGHYMLTNNYRIFFGVAFKGIGSIDNDNNNSSDEKDSDSKNNSESINPEDNNSNNNNQNNQSEEGTEHQNSSGSGGGGCNSGLNLFAACILLLQIFLRKEAVS